MIEFKADCGHTIRARDEDAGGVVRCSYCGRSAGVPDSADTDLSFLFRDIEKVEEAPKKGGLLRSLMGKRRLARRDFNPFAIIFRLGYVAVVIIVVIVLARKVVIPLLDEDVRKERFSGGGAGSTQEDSRPAGRPSSQRFGFVGNRSPRGLIVTSVPGGAQVYFVEEAKAPPKGRIRDVAQCVEFRAGDTPPRVGDGVYVVEAAFPWNDPRLSDPGLAHYDKYVAFRRAIEKAPDEARRKLAGSFFLPDEATDVLVDETIDQIYLVKQYRGVRVQRDAPTVVCALFLPYIVPADRSDGLLLEPLLHGYTSGEKTYRFDEQHVRGELSFYGVPAVDQSFVVEFLARVGVAPYVTPGDGVRFFKIDPQNGNISARLLRPLSP